MPAAKKTTKLKNRDSTAEEKPRTMTKESRTKTETVQSEEKAKQPELRDHKPIPKSFDKFPPPAINPDELRAVSIDRVAEIAGSLLNLCEMSPVKATQMAFELLDLAAGGKRSLEGKNASKEDSVLSNPSYEVGVWHSAHLNDVTRFSLKNEDVKMPLLNIVSEDDQTLGEPLEKIGFKECLKNLMPDIDYGIRKNRFTRWLGFCFGVSPEVVTPIVQFYESEGSIPTHIYLNAKRSGDAWWFIEYKRVKKGSGRLGGLKKK